MAGFQCKQFFVAHDQCAMKVSTDSLLLGSWVDVESDTTLLDVGTGSGLLTLMILQRAPADAQVDAFDIDAAAVEQAKANVAASPWPERARVTCADLQSFNGHKPYQHIVSNPPYFDVQGNSKGYHNQPRARMQARQQNGFTILDLMQFAARTLSSQGRLSCMYPFSAFQQVVRTASQCHLYLRRYLCVSHSVERTPYLVVTEFSRTQGTPVSDELAIRASNGLYSDAYRRLCQPYYLNF